MKYKKKKKKQTMKQRVLWKKIDKLFAKLTKRQREMIQINKIRYEKWDITTDTQRLERWLRGLRALAAPPEDQGLIPSIHMVAYNCL